MAKGWKRTSVGAYTGIDWSQWIRRDQAIDPYLVWADLCGASGFAAPDQNASGTWPVIMQLSKKGLLVKKGSTPSEETVPWIFGCIDIAKVYVTEAADGAQRVDGSYVTASVQPESVSHLLCAGEVARFQLGVPRIPRYPGGGIRPRLPPAAEVRRVVIGIIDDGCAFAHHAFLDDECVPRVRFLWDQDHRRQVGRCPLDWRVPDALGYGGELVHKQLTEAARLAADDDLAPYRAIRYGSFRLDPDTNATSPFDAEGYELPQDTQRAGSHGTSVMHLAAGYPPVRNQGEPTDDAMGPRPSDKFKDLNTMSELATAIADRVSQAAGDTVAMRELLLDADVVDQTAIVFVQLPTRTVADTTGGSLAVHVLDAVRYIERKALEISPANYTPREPEDFTDNPVIVNLSWGSLGGAHDGGSILEGALLELTRTGQRTINMVVAAGNAHRAEHHAEMALSPGQPRSFHWMVGPDNPLEGYLEIWLPDNDIWGCPLNGRLVRELTLTLTSPSGEVLSHVRAGEAWLHGADGSADRRRCDAAAGPSAGVVFCREVAHSQHGTMVLLAVAPTRERGPGASAPGSHGEWLVELAWGSEQAPSGTTATIHAWCERNDLVFGSRRPQQSRVYTRDSRREASEFDPESLAAWHRPGLNAMVPRGFVPTPALSSIAGVPPVDKPAFPIPDSGSGPGYVTVVGGYRLSDGEASRDSSGGPARTVAEPDTRAALRKSRESTSRMRPDLDAPSDAGVAMPGLRTTGTRPGTVVRISGTSAAAAIATRAMANVLFWLSNTRLQRDNLKKIIELLMSSAEPPREPAGARPTLTPRTDDTFRRGDRRVP